MKHWLVILTMCCIIVGCEDVNRRSPIPSVPVNYTLYITREHPHFVTDNGYQTMTITETKFEREYIGYAGLLLWVAMDGNYHAADLCCPHCLKKNKPLIIDGLYAVCPICDEHFDLSYGFAFPTKGITKEPLRKYQTSVNNSITGLTLRVIN